MPTGQDNRMVDERYARHLGLFGAEGQKRIADSSVAIVGLGGVGSHVAQQLAFLGVCNFVLIDADSVSMSNLNRLVGATEEEVGTAKIEVAAQLIVGIQPDANLDTFNQKFEAQAPPREMLDVDIVFGCVDHDAVRLELVAFTSASRRPYIDLASDISAGGEFGGRVVFAKDGARCLSCLGELDQHELARAHMSPEQRAADDAIYGVHREELGDTGPSVVSINGAVASLAVTEFMVWTTGLREPRGFINYRGDRATVGTRANPERDYCHYCMDLWGAPLPSSRGQP
jgi:molybdopterin-synthase adenylyltransferase